MSKHTCILSTLTIRVQDAKWDLSPELSDKGIQVAATKDNTCIHKAQLFSHSPEAHIFPVVIPPSLSS